jgi:hypothetical protein
VRNDGFEAQSCGSFYSKVSIWLNRHFTVTNCMAFLRCGRARLLVLTEVGNIPEIMGQDEDGASAA